ncbi:hypothetical protein ACFYZ8_04595 [Streptomyces sp. NPDC001668]|uniref:hypothetical protein n=1 Tax=unclassified Streptomyces TaxID=2593676 RepID=UPI0036A0E8DF
MLFRHEVRLFVSLALWVSRRTHGTAGRSAFGYARGQGAVMFGFAFVCAVETLTMSVLLRDLPAVHHPILFLDVYTVVFVIGLHAADVVRPHVLDEDSLRIRRAVHVDLRIPLHHIADVRRELRTTHLPSDGELDVPIGSQTTLTLQLDPPVAHFTFVGRRRDIHTVRFHADDPDLLVHTIKQARTAPWTSPDRTGRPAPAAAPPATVPPHPRRSGR